MPINNKTYLLNLLSDNIRSIAAEEASSLLPTGTVFNINLGTGLTATQNPITTSATLSISAGISDLNDVNITGSLVNDQILTWTGTCWQNITFPGLSGTSFSFVDLLDVDIPNLNAVPNNIIAVNSGGNALVSIPNNYVNTINNGQGIETNTSVDTHTVLVSFNPSTLLTNTNIGENDYLVTQRSGLPKRIKLNDTNLSLFNNDIGFLPRDQLTAGTAITITDNGLSVSIGVCLNDIYIDFNAGVSGILGITNGGTSGGTSSEARTNLGLEYNVDVLSAYGPSFRGDMYGNNIVLLPSVFNFTLSNSGTSYTNGTSFELRYSDDIFFPINDLTTGAAGEILNPTSFTLSNQSGISHFDYTTTYDVIPNIGTYGISATYNVVPEDFYLLFGGRYGTCFSDGIGFRDREGNIEIKSTRTGLGSSWRQIFPLSLDGLCDVHLDNPSSEEILIFDGTSFINSTLTGTANYDVFLNTSSGYTTFNLNFADNSIGVSKLDSTVTQTELNYVSGVTSSIQTQLDDKIGDSGFTTGDLIYNNGSCWVALRPDTNLNQIIGISTVQQVPSWGYLYGATTGPINNLSWLNDEFIYLTSGTCPAFRTTLPDYFDNNRLCEATGGLEINTPNKKLQLNIDNLTNNTTIINNDEIAFYDTILFETRKIDIDNFTKNIVDNGLTASNGLIELGVSIPLRVKEFSNTTLLNTYSPSTYRNYLAGVSNSYGGTSLVYSDGLSWYYVNLGDAI